MSMFKVDVAIGNLDGGDLAPVQPVVDTGRPTQYCRNL